MKTMNALQNYFINSRRYSQNRRKWLAIAEKTIAANKKRDREYEWPNIENALVMWIDPSC